MHEKFPAGNIVILTGAGISAESGIRTFRGSDGLWEDHRIEDVATPEAFQRNPALVQRFYNERRQQLQQPAIGPNAAHDALAELERRWPGEFLLVTQNIDDLHERAGSRKLVHMHGELLKMRCLKSGRVYPITQDITGTMRCQCCDMAGTLRPHIVWFGEEPLEMLRIYGNIAHCTTFVSIGTSGNVYPAAGFVREARAAGAHTVELNLEPSQGQSTFAECLYGPATQLVPAFARRMLAAANA